MATREERFSVRGVELQYERCKCQQSSKQGKPQLKILPFVFAPHVEGATRRQTTGNTPYKGLLEQFCKL